MKENKVKEPDKPGVYLLLIQKITKREPTYTDAFALCLFETDIKNKSWKEIEYEQEVNPYTTKMTFTYYYIGKLPAKAVKLESEGNKNDLFMNYSLRP